MKEKVSSSPAPRAQPPRSNPFVRSSSVEPPLPCITPSTVTCVMVVSFMIVLPPLRGTPRGRPLTPATNMHGPIRHPLGDFLPSSIPCVLGAHRPPSLSCMRAAQITRFGGPEVPDIVDVPE